MRNWSGQYWVTCGHDNIGVNNIAVNNIVVEKVGYLWS